jgi:hypothetical protein
MYVPYPIDIVVVINIDLKITRCGLLINMISFLTKLVALCCSLSALRRYHIYSRLIRSHEYDYNSHGSVHELMMY